MPHLPVLGLAVCLSLQAAAWTVVEGVTPKYAHRAEWDGRGDTLLRPQDENYHGDVFTAGIPVPAADFDLSFATVFNSTAGNNPCRIGLVLSDGMAEQVVDVRADGVGPCKFAKVVYNAHRTEFLLKAKGASLSVYHAEPGAAWEMLGEIPLAVRAKTVNFRMVPKHHLHLQDLSVGASGPVPRRRTQRLFAADESLLQPLDGASVAKQGERLDIPLVGCTKLKIDFSGAPNGGILYVKRQDGSDAAFPVYLMDDTFTMPCDVFPKWKRGDKLTFRNSRVSVGWLGQQYVFPRMKLFCSSRDMVEHGRDILRELELLPDFSKHVLTLAFDVDDAGDLSIWIDGSYRISFKKPQKAWFSCNKGCTYRLESSPAKASRYLPLDLAAKPKARAFAAAKLSGLKPGLKTLDGVPFDIVKPLDSQDVGLAQMGMGEWGLGSNAYRSRAPMDGFPMEVHFRLPPAPYVKAHFVFALDPAKDKRKTMRFRLARYSGAGVGSNMIVDTPVDFTDGVPATVKRIGEVSLNGEKAPLYRHTVMLPFGECLDFATHGEYVDFEAVGAEDGVADSAFSIFALTLERAPFVLDMKQRVAGNVFTRDEEKSTAVTLVSTRAAKGELAWTVSDERGNALFSGSSPIAAASAGERSEAGIDLGKLKDCGLYRLDIALKDERGETLLTHPARAAVVPELGRLADADILMSPYATWYFDSAHGGPTNHAWCLPVLQKLGIHKVTWAKPTAEESKRFLVTGNGSAKVANPDFFDYATGKYKPRDGKDGETWVVEDLKRQIAEKPWVDHVTVWHENCPPPGVPEEILGLPVPAATPKDREYAAFFNEAGRIVRKHFPGLRIKVGNSLGSSGACFRTFRGGAKPEYLDAIGMEPVNASVPPERMQIDCLQGMQVSKAAAEHYAKRPVKADGCHEFVSRPVQRIGEDAQARFYMRDILVSLANGFTLISPGGPFDGTTSYHDTVWGGTGYCSRRPYLYPRKACVAYAVLTKAIDAPTAMREVDTGSKSVYALEFRRGDGKFATAIWTTRGKTALKVEGAGGRSVSMMGRERSFGGLFGKNLVLASEEPSYLMTDDPIGKLSVVERRYAETAIGKGATVASALDDLSSVTVEPDVQYKNTRLQCLPVLTPSSAIGVSQAVDSERGACLRLAIDPKSPCASKFLSEYTTLRFKKPAVLPKDATEVGLWVKGDSGCGQVRYELEDAKGNVYKNLQTGGGSVDFYDADMRQSFDFDGWNYLHVNFAKRHNMWTKTGYKSPDWMVPPVRVTAITVSLNRFVPHLDGMAAVKGEVRISGLGGF